MQIVLALALASLVTATPLYERYPAPNTRGPAPKQEWIATYEAAKAAGKIPGFAPAFLTAAGAPAYAAGVDTGENGVCSWTVSHCFGDGDVYDAPDGMYALGFDDGPLPASVELYNFLESNNQTATHFHIGSNILNNKEIFDLAVSTGGHIAVHTWSHPYMSTLTDLEILGELGWTAQIIYDYSGLVPKWWRPPYGDTDDRVRAIAREVFGLTLAGWAFDSSDWCLNEAGSSSCVGSGPANQADLVGELRSWQAGPKSPGVLGLEHELTSHSVGAFIATYSGIKQHGWDARCIPDLFGADWYLNGVRDNVTEPGVSIGSGPHDAAAPAPSSATSSSAVSASTASFATSSSGSASSATATAASSFTTIVSSPGSSTSAAATVQSQQAPTTETRTSAAARGRLVAPAALAALAVLAAAAT
ncbi:hypothetical protein JCM10213v2_001192 [Rhodosporidiobolus nylandii]